MGRLARTGLEYFSVDTTWETSMRLVRAKYGIRGIGFMIELYASIYHDNFFRLWDDENELLFSDEIREPVEFVQEMIEYCFLKNLLDREVFDKKGVLTSHGIQKRYFKTSQDLHRTNVISEIGLVYLDLVEKYNLRGNGDIPGEKADIPGEKPDFSGKKDHAYKGMKGNFIRGEEEGSAAAQKKNPPAAPFVDIPENQENQENQEEQEERELYAFTLRRISARKKKPENLETYAKSIMHAEDNLEAFKAEQIEQEPEARERITHPPEPGPCECSGKIATLTIDRGRCLQCGALYEYDPSFGEWLKESAASSA